MMGHSSTAMVDRVYGKLDEASYRRAIARLPGGTAGAQPTQEPGCHVGVTSAGQAGGEHGTHGMGSVLQRAVDPVEESAAYEDRTVRAEGLATEGGES